MRVSASLMGIAVMLGLLGCQGSDEASVAPRPTTSIVTTWPPQKVLTPEERVSQWISACEVREILFTHENIAYITLRDGEQRRVRLDEAAEDRVAATAFQQRCPDRKGKHIIVAIE
jgi:hypothetical protein